MSDPNLRHPDRPAARQEPLRVFISAAEPSGDQHAASLIHAIRRLQPDVEFFGVAGPLMQGQGCTAIDDWTGRSAMLLGALGLVKRAWRLLGEVSRQVRSEGVNLAILVDSPALHLPMAKRIKAAGCPVLYYIAPQLWAWAPWRMGRVRRRVDRLATILPFEEAYFRRRGVDARFVGHPLIEQWADRSIDTEWVASFKRAGQPVIACLPGSRRQVIAEVLPGMVEVAREIARQYPRAVFLFSGASGEAEGAIRDRLADESFSWQVQTGHNGELLTAADLALCASGTMTLEVACHRVPMVVMYNHSKWGYRLIGRWLIRTEHLCLVNILAGRKIVPEFMPFYTSTGPIAAEALDLLGNDARRATTKQNLDTMITSLGTGSAADGTARMALEMMATTPHAERDDAR